MKILFLPALTAIAWLHFFDCHAADSTVLPSDTHEAIEQVRKGGNLSRARLTRAVIELQCKNASYEVKLEGLEALIQIGAAVLETRNFAIDISSNIGRLPEFDALALGAKYQFYPGMDYEAIEEPKIREAYKDALAKHQFRLALVSPELDKNECALEILRAAKHFLNDLNSERAVEHAKLAISKLTSQVSVTTIVSDFIFPPTPSSAGKKDHTGANPDTNQPKSAMTDPRVLSPPIFISPSNSALNAQTASQSTPVLPSSAIEITINEVALPKPNPMHQWPARAAGLTVALVLFWLMFKCYIALRR